MMKGYYSILFLFGLWASQSMVSSFSLGRTSHHSKATTTPAFDSALFAVQSTTKGQGYKPKWVKKTTLADEEGSIDSIGYDKVGLKGTIPVIFQQGNETRTSMAFAGQPLRDVASQAGQYIRYGCGKGECGTCECRIDGQWVRPCVATVPAMISSPTTGEVVPLTVNIKAVKNKSSSSGTFFSIRSFFMGFWNNILGMVGFAKFREAARKNWEERWAYEEAVRVKTLEKKTQRLAREAAALATATQKKKPYDPAYPRWSMA